jgi:hypothetical protein
MAALGMSLHVQQQQGVVTWQFCNGCVNKAALGMQIPALMQHVRVI